MTETCQRTGLTIDEYFELLRQPDDDLGRPKPMNTFAAARHLRSRGYDVLQATLDMLIELEVVTLAQSDVWTPANIEFVAMYFEDCQLFMPYAEMCMTLGCHYADFLRALRAAAERESSKYGCHVPAFDQYFVMRRFPPRCVPESAGNLSGTKPAIITFTLADDVRERLERGEEV